MLDGKLGRQLQHLLAAESPRHFNPLIKLLRRHLAIIPLRTKLQLFPLDRRANPPAQAVCAIQIIRQQRKFIILLNLNAFGKRNSSDQAVEDEQRSFNGPNGVFLKVNIYRERSDGAFNMSSESDPFREVGVQKLEEEGGVEGKLVREDTVSADDGFGLYREEDVAEGVDFGDFGSGGSLLGGRWGWLLALAGGGGHVCGVARKWLELEIAGGTD